MLLAFQAHLIMQVTLELIDLIRINLLNSFYYELSIEIMRLMAPG